MGRLDGEQNSLLPGNQPNPLQNQKQHLRRPPRCIAINPHLAVCPDFSMEMFALLRDKLIQGGLADNDDVAVVRLAADWSNENERDKLTWDRQAEKGESKEHEWHRSSPNWCPVSLRAKTPSKKPFHALIQIGVMGPSIISLAPAPWALERLAEGLYVPLGYFTFEGRREAAKLIPDDAAQQLSNVPRDEELSWEEVSDAVFCLIKWARRAGWKDQHLEILTLFYDRLSQHDVRCEPEGNEAVVLYQARYRREWHHAMDEGNLWDLSEINESALRDIAFELLQKSLNDRLASLQQERQPHTHKDRRRPRRRARSPSRDRFAHKRFRA